MARHAFGQPLCSSRRRRSGVGMRSSFAIRTPACSSPTRAPSRPCGLAPLRRGSSCSATGAGSHASSSWRARTRARSRPRSRPGTGATGPPTSGRSWSCSARTAGRWATPPPCTLRTCGTGATPLRRTGLRAIPLRRLLSRCSPRRSSPVSRTSSPSTATEADSCSWISGPPGALRAARNTRTSPGWSRDFARGDFECSASCTTIRRSGRSASWRRGPGRRTPRWWTRATPWPGDIGCGASRQRS